MKFVRMILAGAAMSSTMAFGLDLSYGNGEMSQGVHIGKDGINVTNMGGQKIRVKGSKVDVEGMNGESVHTDDNKVDVEGMNGESVQQEGSKVIVDGSAGSGHFNGKDNRKAAGTSSLKFNKLRLDVNAGIHVHLGDKMAVDLGEDGAAISIKTEKGLLTLSTGSGEAADGTDVDVWAQKLDAIVLDSAGDIEFDGVNQRDLEITLNGAGSIRVSGHVENLVATINGSGDLQIADLVAEKAIVKNNGAGTVSVNVRRELKAYITGAGDILYRGNPARVIPKISGAGDVVKEED